jgi:hypothetical protein
LATSYHFSSFLNFIESYTKFELDIMFDLNLFSMSRKKPNDTSFNKCHKTIQGLPNTFHNLKKPIGFGLEFMWCNSLRQFPHNYLIKHHIKHIMQKAFYTSSILNICTFHNLSFALLRTTSDDKFYFSYVFIRFSIISSLFMSMSNLIKINIHFIGHEKRYLNFFFLYSCWLIGKKSEVVI